MGSLNDILFVFQRCFCFFFYNLNIQFVECCWIGEVWCFGYQVGGCGGFWESDNVVDVIGIGQQYGQMVKIEGQICMWWCIVFQCIQQEVEFFMLFLFVNVQNIKYGLLYFVVVDLY